ncbi:uncharacterized protein LOC112688814 isoform X2 [Sipha flava]|uniref:Uncharacterized protein LOC112688814 isoform X2 n=1 Tax=Sipha flava TaxID=143950 RepID=A0A8B8G5K6_9HEMI|nr:uncharacterized protein LOC112688814 isoform X2 [Sipha flava]
MPDLKLIQVIKKKTRQFTRSFTNDTYTKYNNWLCGYDKRKTNILSMLDSSYRRGIELHNEKVSNNRYILNVTINCIRFSSAFELALRRYDEKDTSLNPVIFRSFGRSCSRRLPKAAQTRWNFHSRTVNIVFEYKEELITCMEKIISDESIKHIPTIEQASRLKRTLLDNTFIYWLTIFHNIMPHVDILYSQLQKRETDSTTVKNNIENFIRDFQN